MPRAPAVLAIGLGLLATAPPASALAAVSASTGPSAAPLGGSRVGTFDEPVYLASPPGDPSTQAVVQRYGLIRLVRRGRVLRRPLLDLRSGVRIDDDRETVDQRGLLSMAFAPDYARGGRFYVDYVNRAGRLRVDAARRGSQRTRRILDLGVATNMHHGGQLQFGRDGRLYVSTGMGDEPAASQDPADPRGKLLRIDPSDPDAEPELVALGLRNPWRFSFDRTTGLLLVGDVGGSKREEVDILDPAAPGPVNFGWPFAEGGRTEPGAPVWLAPARDRPRPRPALVLDRRRLRRPRARPENAARPLPLRRRLQRRPVERPPRPRRPAPAAPARRPHPVSRLLRRGRPRADLRGEPERRGVAAQGVNLTVITSPSAIA